MKVSLVFISTGFEHFVPQTYIEYLFLFFAKEPGLYINVFVD